MSETVREWNRWSTGEAVQTTLLCRLFGHRWVYGVATVPDCHIWDCSRRGCRRHQIRGDVR